MQPIQQPQVAEQPSNFPLEENNAPSYYDSLIKIKNKLADHFKVNYPLEGCLKNITIGLIGGVIRVGIDRFLFVSAATSTPLTLTITAIYIIKSCILAPLCEEAFFRGSILKGMLIDAEKANSGILGKIQAIAFSSLLFGCVHFFLSAESLQMRVMHVASSTIGGLFYGTAYGLTGNLWAPTIAHSIFNASHLL